MKKLASIAIATALLGALAFVCFNVTKFSGDEHGQFKTALWRLKHLDTTFNEGVLEARFALVDNYDDFHTQEKELAQLVESLNQPPAFIGPADRTAIEQARLQYETLLEERDKLFERFKSQNAMLANSRRYLPGALEELVTRLQASGDRELQDMVGDITRLTLMRLSSPDELPADAPARFDRLKQWATGHPQHEESMFVLSIMQHAQMIVAGNGQLDALTRRLLELPTSTSIEKLFQAYEVQVVKALHKAQYYRTFLYVLGLMVVAGIGYAIWALRSANRKLEQRVAERTSELAGSEERFRTLCVASPIGIYMTDSAGGCVYSNPSFEAIWCLTREQCLGEGWVSALHPDDRTCVLADWLAATKSGETFAREFRLQPPGEEMRWVFSQAAVIRAAAGQITGFVGTVQDITKRKRSEADLEMAHGQLLETSRKAGMAEVATSVLHNVGNVLNSVNVSSTLVTDTLRKSKADNLAKVVKLLREHEASLGDFLTIDPKGKQLPSFLAQLAVQLSAEHTRALEELAHLQENVDHIKDIVSKQQSYAVVSGVSETVKINDLVEDALRLNAGTPAGHDVEIVREIAEVPLITIEKHKVLQILVNLISNAKNACQDSGRPDKRMTMRVTNGEGSIKIAVADNGVGIPPENQIRIFNHGFTTRTHGHGFGLHNGALTAKQLGGQLRMQSDGAGQGATFTLELPVDSTKVIAL
jgi:PAS domain S-box-containing protein